ncbi:hypothetical protein [Thalassovita mangrovi]|uniref:Uncharacterized protein n=1 Tax=Thalassovita mangrovi TaxID=2692236 RepID=A0A6L8LKV9_9RHOB|nr:hypothetical protein [Thalassovita mangrovi]MYM53759.1 hypothetical protein [Thalassovita mangrovi]
MTEEHPLGPVCGHDDLAHLPPKEWARMRRLRDWLAAPSWKPAQAIAVLCGYDPEVGRNSCAADMSFLPGADDFYGVPFGAREPEDLKELDAGLEAQHGFIGELRLITMKPMKAIAKAVAAGVPIPWLEVARADPECLKYLPPEALDDSEDAPRVTRTAPEVASLGGQAKRDKDLQRAKWLPVVEKRLAEGRKRSEILAELEMEDDAPPQSTFYGWCAQIKSRKGSN